jgi:hypothetical protein
LGLWFNDPKDAASAGLPPTVTPFNGEHNAGLQVLSTRNFPDDSGPLSKVTPYGKRSRWAIASRRAQDVVPAARGDFPGAPSAIIAPDDYCQIASYYPEGDFVDVMGIEDSITGARPQTLAANGRDRKWRKFPSLSQSFQG